MNTIYFMREKRTGSVPRFALQKSRHIWGKTIDVLEILVDEHRHHVTWTAFEHDLQEGPSLSFLQVQELG